MTARIPGERSQYGRRRPFEVLGVDPAAGSEEIRGAYERQVASAESASLEGSERARRLGELKAAYDVLREPRARALVEMFLLDDEIGPEGCRKVARIHASRSFDGDAALECEEELSPAAPAPRPPEGVPRVVSLGTRLRLRAEGAGFLPDRAREASEAIRFER